MNIHKPSVPSQHHDMPKVTCTHSQSKETFTLKTPPGMEIFKPSRNLMVDGIILTKIQMRNLSLGKPRWRLVFWFVNPNPPPNQLLAIEDPSKELKQDPMHTRECCKDRNNKTEDGISPRPSAVFPMGRLHR